MAGRRVSGVLAATAFALASACLAGQTKSQPYFPVKKGITWKYEGDIVSTAGGSETKIPAVVTGEITDSVTLRGKSTVKIKTTLNGLAQGEDIYVIWPEGIDRVAYGTSGGLRLNPPLPMLKLPATKGKTWSWRGKMVLGNGSSVPAMADFRVLGSETLKTPVGIFNTLKVDMRVDAESAGKKIAFPATLWYAKNVGIVRIRSVLSSPGIDGSVTVDFHLMEFKN